MLFSVELNTDAGTLIDVCECIRFCMFAKVLAQVLLVQSTRQCALRKRHEADEAKTACHRAADETKMACYSATDAAKNIAPHRLRKNSV